MSSLSSWESKNFSVVLVFSVNICICRVYWSEILMRQLQTSQGFEQRQNVTATGKLKDILCLLEKSRGMNHTNVTFTKDMFTYKVMNFMVNMLSYAMLCYGL